MENPNVYDDDKYVSQSSKLDSAIGGMWEAGASIKNIEDTVANALENCDIPRVTVSVMVEG